MYLARFIFAGLIFTFSAHAFATHPIIIKFSHVVAPSAPKGKAALRFKELVELNTKGQVEVEVEVYPNSQLYKDFEELEALQLGAAQMLAPSLPKFGALGLRDFEVFYLPYIFPNKETLYRVMDGEIGKKIAQQTRSQRHHRAGLVG